MGFPRSPREGRPRRAPQRDEPPPLPQPARLVENIARRLVQRPEEVSVEETSSEEALTVVLRVDPGDLGAVIGRRGRLAKALRALLSASGARHRRRFRLEVAE